jgi:hypothetical protein
MALRQEQEPSAHFHVDLPSTDSTVSEFDSRLAVSMRARLQVVPQRQHHVGHRRDMCPCVFACALMLDNL